MLRTIIVRRELIRGTIRKAIRSNLTRTFTIECSKRLKKCNQGSLVEPLQKAPWQYGTVRYYSSLPKHIKVPLPALSPTMESGNIMNWAKKEGDKLNEGDLLCEIETDKATMGFETPEEGYLAKIVIPAGTKNVKIGQLVCIIVENQADVEAFKNYAPEPGAAVAAPTAPAASVSTPPPADPTPAAASSPPAGNFPAHIPVPLPALSPTMEAGNIQSWSKKEGDKLNEGDLLCEIETDKATMGFETPEEGYLAKIIVPAGTKNVKIGQIVCVIVENEADIAAFKNYQPGAAAPTAAAPAAATPAAAPAAPAAAPAGPAKVTGESRIYASPLARKMAKEKGIELSGKGSGVYDSITSKDLAGMTAGAGRQSAMAAGLAQAHAQRKGAPATPAAAAATAPAAAPRKPGKGYGPSTYTDVPLSNVRNIIAQRLLESKTTIPHYYLFQSCQVDKLIELRKKFNTKLEKDKIRLSINDFIMKATACASMRVPEVNAAWTGTAIRQFDDVDISLAVATPKGLITPIVFSANKKGLIEISRECKELAKKARDNKLQPHEFQGGTISVSNLGMFGTSFFNAIINPPQSAILAIGGNETRVLPDPDSKSGFKACEFIIVSLSADHRVTDGALGAQWLKAFRLFIEEPESMIL